MQRLLPQVTPATLRADLMAGLLGAILALPQGIAFAKLAGLPPQYGIATAIVPCAIAALFGSSRHVVSGPTNANSLALFAGLSPIAAVGSPLYLALACAAAGIVGLVQLALGAFRLAWLTDFIAPAVLLGFITGAAILIGLYAVPDVLGVQAVGGHGAYGVLSRLPAMLAGANAAAVIVAAATLAATVGLARISRKLPFMLGGIATGYLLSEGLMRLSHLSPVILVGEIPSVVPVFALPYAPLSNLSDLVSIAGALAIVALGQTVSVAKALARRSGQRLDFDREFVGQGLSNLVGSLFSCYVSCGSLNRSLPNYIAGARTSFAAISSAFFLLALAVLTRPLLERIPMPAIGALLLYIAYALIDVGEYVRLAKLYRSDLAIAIVTLVCMLVLPFQQAILIGTGLSLVLYLKRTSHPVVHVLVPDLESPGRTFTPIQSVAEPTPECPQLKLVRIEGALYYGAAGFISQRLHELRSSSRQKHLLLMAKSMNFIDQSGAEVWEQELDARRRQDGGLYFHRPRPSVMATWKANGFTGRLGPENVFGTKRAAIAAIFGKLDKSICATCSARIFEECHGVTGERVDGGSHAPASASRLEDVEDRCLDDRAAQLG